MSNVPDLDPFGVARKWMSEWEKLVNQHGTEMLAKPEAAQAMQAFSSAALQAQAASNEASGRVLAAANLPSRADFEAMGARLGQMEAALVRIEALLKTLAPDQPGARPSPPRTRKPPNVSA